MFPRPHAAGPHDTPHCVSGKLQPCHHRPVIRSRLIPPLAGLVGDGGYLGGAHLPNLTGMQELVGGCFRLVVEVAGHDEGTMLPGTLPWLIQTAVASASACSPACRSAT